MLQINLNRPELWPKPIPLNARQMVGALIVVALGLGAAYGYLQYRTLGAETALERAEAERQKVQRELTALQKAQKSRQQALERLRGEIAELEKRLRAHKRAKEAMERRLQAAGKKAELVRGLGEARRGRPDVWLTRFQLNGIGEVDVTLEGRARVPESIPRYLQSVADQSAFRKGFFQDLSANEPEEDGAPEDRLDFKSQTRFFLAPEQGEGQR